MILPIKIVSTANLREHWSKRAKRAKLHRESMVLALTAEVRARPAMPCIVTLTRIAPRELDDDNLASGMKAARDGVADWLGIDDRDPRVTWRYAQKPGAPKEYAVEVSFAECAHLIMPTFRVANDPLDRQGAK